MSSKKLKQEKKERSVKYKGGKCEICGYDKCNRSLDFHHIDPNTKEYKLGQIMNRKWSIIKRELDKCILVCAN